jgi:hypothetical protein
VASVLTAFAADPLFAEKFTLAFGTTVSSEQFLQTVTALPQIEVHSDAELKGTLGAFSSQTQKIYLSESLLKEDSARLRSVLIEEIGHFVDAQVNGVDSPGDEGAIFAAVVLGQDLSEVSLEKLKQEDDSSVLIIDGSQIAVELSEPGNTIETALDFGTISYSLISPLAMPIFKQYADYVGGDDSDDYFKFTIDKRLGTNISFTAPTNTKLELLNDKGNLITSKISSESSSSTQIRENLDAGTYYLNLSTTNTTASYYNLDFLVAPPDNVTDSFSTPKDLGTLTSTPVSNSDYLFSYSYISLYDFDRYKFTLSQTSTVSFDLTDDAQSNTSFNVYNNLLVANLTNDSSKTSATSQKILEAGTYTVSLSGFGAYSSSASKFAPTAYTFTLSSVPITFSGSNLVVTDFTAPTIIVSGQSINVSWTVQNQGDVDANNDWYDRVVYSVDNIWGNEDDIYLAELNPNWYGNNLPLTPNASYTLTPNASYTLTENFYIPNNVLGDGYLLVKTDIAVFT